MSLSVTALPAESQPVESGTITPARKQAGRLLVIAATVCLAAIVGLTASLSAQNRNRFEILSRDSMSDGGLRITVVRDNQLSSCFAVFMVESPVPPPAL